MCQISVCNLRDPILNKKLFLIMGSNGSIVHKDGWGFSMGGGDIWKCPIPMFVTTDAGEILRTKASVNKGILIGHIRQASPKVPVETKNSHPFKDENIVFLHNGKLTPKKESDFVLEEDADDLDKNGNPIKDKDGNIKKRKVSISDSLIFFQSFMKEWRSTTETDSLEKFLAVLNKTMSLFYGKFAFVFTIDKTTYVVRGKTADLFVSYLRETEKKDSPVIGWAVNTSKEVLLDSLILLSNLQQLDGKKELFFDYPTLLPDETVFKAHAVGLAKVGEIKENYAPITYAKSYSPNPTKGGTSIVTGETNKPTTELENYAKEIYDFMFSYSLTIYDIQAMFFKLYGASLEEISIGMLRHFCRRVIPAVAIKVKKDTRKRLRKQLSNMPVGLFRYGNEFEYPWIMNTRERQIQFVDRTEESLKVDTK